MKSEFFWNKTNFKIQKKIQHCVWYCTAGMRGSRNFFQGGPMHNFVFQGGGVGGVGGLFSGILRCEFNRFEFNKFPPPPPTKPHMAYETDSNLNFL